MVDGRFRGDRWLHVQDALGFERGDELVGRVLAEGGEHETVGVLGEVVQRISLGGPTCSLKES